MSKVHDYLTLLVVKPSNDLPNSNISLLNSVLNDCHFSLLSSLKSASRVLRLAFCLSAASINSADSDFAARFDSLILTLSSAISCSFAAILASDSLLKLATSARYYSRALSKSSLASVTSSLALSTFWAGVLQLLNSILVANTVATAMPVRDTRVFFFIVCIV